ncbi:MAG TPA: histidine--tRNA ligase [Flavobacteriaceae bacterium]|nr:histidine--tRNA ligase [Ulvibacter sp.]HAH34193.1 histidine--tRNA ligase [Flavobacteriaceae bacterium]|tara:strand:+ start:2465 stop:3841 length:1377 start_codon:yes stop_codon:yes gene_type:complete
MKPSIPKGTRDFSPAQVAKRNYIMDTIKQHFSCFGFQAIETPSFEKSETLMGKYGEEGDRLIFKILNSGDYLKKATDTFLTTKDSQKLTTQISEKALRYDLTVPFARYVVQHQNDITFPFKRFQIQPVWRADRPQKGRFREFYQCDADVVGSTSLLQEVELVQLYDAVFTSLKLKGSVIKINNRKILSGIAQVIGAQDKLIDFTVALDKLDKIGPDGVKKEMLEKGISQDAITKVQPLFSFKGTAKEQLESLKGMLSASQTGMQGIQELEFIVANVSALELQTATLAIDVTLARGLNYYTGAIFEVSAPQGITIGSIGGGGRYDDLTGIFGLKDVSGVGISFGLDRIYLVLEELGLFPETTAASTDVLFFNFGETEALFAMKAIKQLRSNGISAELYPDIATNQKKERKQLTYAERKGIPYLVLLKDQQIQDNTFIIRNMQTGDKQTVGLEELIEIFK